MNEMITVQVDVKKDLETVWKVWIGPEHIVKWYFASDEWHCPSVENDFVEGGTFCFRMAAKDGSMAFDFDGTYSKIVKHELIDFTLKDGRKVSVSFTQKSNEVIVEEAFDPDDQFSLQMQQDGWQTILDNFKKYVESL